MKARTQLELVAIILVLCGFSACQRKAEMCARCHMALKAGDVHRSEITYANGSTAQFDSAICAITTWQQPPPGLTPKSLQVHEYYSGSARDGAAVTFVKGTDVPSTMGDDLVAVDPANLKKFQADHGGTALTLTEIEEPSR